MRGTSCTSRPNTWPIYLRCGTILSPLTSFQRRMFQGDGKRALLNFAIIQDILFDVSQVIEDAILYNWDAKMNLGHPFLIYGLCKNVGVLLEDNEAWIHPIKAIVVKKDKSSVPRSEAVYDSGHEPSDDFVWHA